MRFLKRKPKQPSIAVEELIRLHRLEELVGKLIKLLDDGQVDYDLVKEIKVVLSE